MYFSITLEPDWVKLIRLGLVPKPKKKKPYTEVVTYDIEFLTIEEGNKVDSELKNIFSFYGLQHDKTLQYLAFSAAGQYHEVYEGLAFAYRSQNQLKEFATLVKLLKGKDAELKALKLETTKEQPILIEGNELLIWIKRALLKAVDSSTFIPPLDSKTLPLFISKDWGKLSKLKTVNHYRVKGRLQYNFIKTMMIYLRGERILMGSGNVAITKRQCALIHRLGIELMVFDRGQKDRDSSSLIRSIIASWREKMGDFKYRI